MKLTLRERVAHQTMQSLTSGQNHRSRHAETRGQCDVTLRERAEQEIDHQRDLGREAGVAFLAARVAAERGETDEPERDRRDGYAATRQPIPPRSPPSANVRTPAAARFALVPFRLSRSTPSSIPTPSAVAIVNVASVIARKPPDGTMCWRGSL
jgi:hypothetical protein